MSRSIEELRELADRDVGPEEGDGESTRTDDAGGTEAGRSAGAGTTGSAGTTAGSGESRPRLGRIPFSPKGFLITFGVLAAALVAGSAVPLLGGLVRYPALFAAAFALGLARSRRAYLETAVAGALAAGGAFVLGTLTTGTLVLGTSLIADYGVPIAGVGVAVGALLSVAGVYFGRDLRDGLTREIDTAE